MIIPVLKDDALLSDIRSAGEDQTRFHCWWLGQSGFLIQWRGKHLLFDPYLSDSLTRKYATTDKPHVRMTERVIAPDQLDFINVVTSTHNHTDHLDGETLGALFQANPELEIIIPEANREFVAERLGMDPRKPRGVNSGRRVPISGFEIHGVPAAHEALETDAKGNHRFLGYLVRFGPWTVYHSGDTILFDGLEVLLKRWSIDLAILPINGSLPERRVSGNLWGREAAKLAKDIEAEMVIPCHYEMFDFNTESPEEFRETCEALEQPYQVLRAGERWSSPEASRDEGEALPNEGE
ncbi:MAG: MBL fold metallo-hydrolase [Verrucomicrobia bacterium]|jgi:L-ascorbate metabolism protein UlaG (beta-lactamase superfamily)|nr:MBL fold metallo-hydrolase [Verrucomicrobiota bacterium]